MEEEKSDAFIEKLRAHLGHVNEFVQLVLNSHLEVEGDLDKLVDRIFFHPEHLEDARLSFPQKVHIARSYTTESHNAKEWSVMLALHAMRNRIAHRSRNKVLKVNVTPLREVTSKAFPSNMRLTIKRLGGTDVVVYAAALCCGFLVVLEEELAKAQGEEIEEDAEA
jgi:hypothetical protein